jgi:hypothetical protein
VDVRNNKTDLFADLTILQPVLTYDHLVMVYDRGTKLLVYDLIAGQWKSNGSLVSNSNFGIGTFDGGYFGYLQPQHKAWGIYNPHKDHWSLWQSLIQDVEIFDDTLRVSSLYDSSQVNIIVVDLLTDIVTSNTLVNTNINVTQLQIEYWHSVSSNIYYYRGLQGHLLIDTNRNNKYTVLNTTTGTLLNYELYQNSLFFLTNPADGTEDSFSISVYNTVSGSLTEKAPPTNDIHTAEASVTTAGSDIVVIPSDVAPLHVYTYNIQTSAWEYYFQNVSDNWEVIGESEEGWVYVYSDNAFLLRNHGNWSFIQVNYATNFRWQPLPNDALLYSATHGQLALYEFCSSDSHCNDHNHCTADTCNENGICEHATLSPCPDPVPTADTTPRPSGTNPATTDPESSSSTSVTVAIWAVFGILVAVLC